MADWMPKSARPYRPASAIPDVSGVESFARGAYQGAGMGFADEQAGALDAIGGHLRRTFTNDWKHTGGGWWDDIKAEAQQVADDYRQGRDESRQAYSDAAEANPTAYGVGQFGGAVATGLLTGGASALGRAGLKGALTAGALEGAAGGLGGSNADLTYADLDAYAKAFRDTSEGGITGAGLGAGFYGAGKGLKWAGGKAVGALRGARAELEAGVSAEREAADAAARAAEEKAAGRLVKDEYAARQQNARMDRVSQRQAAMEAAKRAREEARAAREAERAAQQEGRARSAAEREADRFSEARTTVDKGLRNLDQENQAAAAEAERMAAQQERQAAAAARESDRFANSRTSIDRSLRDLHRENQAAARAAARPPLRVARNPPASGPMEDPNTAILGGYRGKAGERRAVNYDRVRQYRQDIVDPNFTGDRARLEQYAREYGDAVDNPGVFERRMVERYLRENYPAEVADRILRERVGPNGEILPRRPVDTPEVTQQAPIGNIADAMGENPRYLRQRDSGLGAQDLGAGRFGDETFAYPNEDIRRSQAPSGDPFHDAPTRAALIRTSPDEGIQGLTENPLHQFEFRDPKTGREYTASIEVDPSNPEVVHLNYVGPAGIDPREAMMAGYDASKNALGPGMVKQMAAEAARAFPEARRMSAWRITGANADRDMAIRLPEVTRAERTPAIRGASPEGEFERALIARNTDDLPASARRAARAWETAPQTQVEGLAPIPRGHRRLYRGEAFGGEPREPMGTPGTLDYEDLKNADGRWFTDRAGLAHEYARGAAESSGGTPIAKYIDVPEGEARQYRADMLPEGRFANEAFREWLPPRSAIRDAEVMLRPKDVPMGLDDGMNANVPFWDRGIGDDVWVNPAAEDVRAGDLTQRINFETEATQAGRGGPPPAPRPAPQPTQVGREPPVSMEDLRQWTGTPEAPRAPEGLPPLEELTQSGAPSFPSDVRRAQPFQERPQLRPEYQPRPPEPRPVFDEALAERRAMGANAQAGAGGMPTRNLGPARAAPPYDPNNSMVAPRDFDAETVVPLGDTQVPRAPRPAPYAGPAAPELAPEPVLANPLRQARPRPLAPPMAPPAQTVMGAPPGSLVRQARQSVGEIAQQREQDALGDVVRAGWEGARDANNALAAPFGAAYGIGKEALQNPAVRARAISLFRLDRLARVRPEVWARVGPTLQRAFQAGPERFKAERHVLLLRDPDFRAAEAEADAELERMDGQSPTRRAAGAGR